MGSLARCPPRSSSEIDPRKRTWLEANFTTCKELLYCTWATSSKHVVRLVPDIFQKESSKLQIHNAAGLLFSCQ